MYLHPFYAYVIDTRISQTQAKKIYFPEPLLINGFYMSQGGIKYMWEYEGKINVSDPSNILFSHLQGEENDRYLVNVGEKDFITLTESQIIERGIMNKELTEQIKERRKLKTIEIEDEENDESESTDKPKSKPKKSTGKGSKAK